MVRNLKSKYPCRLSHRRSNDRAIRFDKSCGGTLYGNDTRCWEMACLWEFLSGERSLVRSELRTRHRFEKSESSGGIGACASSDQDSGRGRMVNASG